MVLEHDARDVDGSSCLAAAEVKEQVNTLHVDAGHIALPEDIVLSSLQVDAVGKVEDIVIAVHHELHGNTVQVLVTVEDAREVIVVIGRGRDVGGLEGHLGLPLVGCCLGQVYGIVITVGLKAGISNLAPSGSVPEEHVIIHVLPHVEVTVRIKSAEFLLLVFAGEDEAPSDAAIGGLIDEDHLLGRQRLDAETRVLVLGIRTDIGESGVGSELDIGLLAHVAVGISPVILLKSPTSGLVTDGGIPVGTSRAPLGCTCVHVGHTVFTGIIVERATLAVLGGEGNTVVIYTEVLLLAGLCRPPSCTGSTGGATSHVGHLAIVDAPLLLGNAAEIVGVVDFGLIEGVLLLDTRLAYTVAVTQAQLNGV